jgi:hypothetical protein
MRIDIEAAISELQEKPKAQIEEETALVWAARAGAAYTLFLEGGAMGILLDAEGYYTESLEHAGASEIPQLAFNITHALYSLRCKALRKANVL